MDMKCRFCFCFVLGNRKNRKFLAIPSYRLVSKACRFSIRLCDNLLRRLIRCCTHTHTSTQWDMSYRRAAIGGGSGLTRRGCCSRRRLLWGSSWLYARPFWTRTRLFGPLLQSRTFLKCSLSLSSLPFLFLLVLCLFCTRNVWRTEKVFVSGVVRIRRDSIEIRSGCDTSPRLWFPR